ncbi:hypothetical protein Bca4012_003824 [Brassica carinata]
MRMAALVRRRAHRKERKLVTVRWIVSVGGVRSRPCSTDSSCGNCCNFVEFPRKLLTGQVLITFSADIHLQLSVFMIVNGWFLQDMSYKDQSILYEPIKELDVMLNQVNAGVSVDIISGVNDPAVFLFYSHRSVAFSLDQHLITPSDHVEIFTHLMWIISDFLELMVRKSMTFTSTQKLKASLILSKEH